MKRTLQYIYDKHPKVKERMEGKNTPLTNTEDVFYQLALFIKEPDTYSFNISLLYKYLEGEDLIFALKNILTFFQNDTFLLGKDNNVFNDPDVLEKQTMYNQKMFANYLIEKGLTYSVGKLNVLYNRGKVPKGDLLIDNTPYWYEQTVKLFANEEIEKINAKAKKQIDKKKSNQ